MRTWLTFRSGALAVGAMVALAAPAGAQDSEAVSLDGTLTGAHWPDMAAPACDDPTTSWRFKIVVGGQLADLGDVEALTTHCTIFDAEGGADPVYYDRTTMLTTADGDMLALVHDFPTTEMFVGDEGQFTGFVLDGTWEAVGGTGRFMHAAGTGNVTGTADIPGDIVLDFDGEITLDAPEPPAE